MLDKETVIKMCEQYASEVLKILNQEAIVLFGSYSKGTEKIDSDIDIAIIVDVLIEDYLVVSKQLYKLRRNISASIEPILIISSSDKSGFVDEILRRGIIIYKSQKW